MSAESDILNLINFYFHNIITNINKQSQTDLLKLLFQCKYIRNMSGETSPMVILHINAEELEKQLETIKQVVENKYGYNSEALEIIYSDYFAVSIYNQLYLSNIDFDNNETCFLKEILEAKKCIEGADLNKYYDTYINSDINIFLSNVREKNNNGFLIVLSNMEAVTDINLQKQINDYLAIRTPFPLIALTSNSSLLHYGSSIGQYIEAMHDYNMIDCSQKIYKLS